MKERIHIPCVNDFTGSEEGTYLLHAEPREDAVDLIYLYGNNYVTEGKDGEIYLQMEKEEIPELVSCLLNNDIKIFGIIPTAKPSVRDSDSTDQMRYCGKKKEEYDMDVDQTTIDLMKRTKKGITMIYVGVVYWFLLGASSFLNLETEWLGLFYLIGTGMIFPSGLLVAKLLKVDFFANDHPLSIMAGVLGGVQILFAPILILIFMERVEWLPFFVAVLTGAHFLPYAVLYKSKGYLFQSFAVVGFTSIIGFGFMEQVYTLLPFGVGMIYLITCLLISKENKKLLAGKKATEINSEFT